MQTQQTIEKLKDFEQQRIADINNSKLSLQDKILYNMMLTDKIDGLIKAINSVNN
jgi:hypothetical protein